MIALETKQIATGLTNLIAMIGPGEQVRDSPLALTREEASSQHWIASQRNMRMLSPKTQSRTR